MKDKTKLLHERALITCVIMLFLCIILKLFGVQWFDLDTSMPILNKIDTILNRYPFSIFIFNFLSCYINMFFIVGITTRKETKEILKVCNFMSLFIVIGFLVYYATNNDVMKFVYDTLLLFIACKCLNSDKILYRFVLTCILNVIYQIFSMFIRNLAITVYDDNLVISLLMNLDYYILLLLTYLYSRRCEKWGILVFGSSLANRLWRRRTTNSKQSLQNKER